MFTVAAIAVAAICILLYLIFRFAFGIYQGDDFCGKRVNFLSTEITTEDRREEMAFKPWLRVVTLACGALLSASA
ncbi:hypothetical protein, partial [Nitrosospira sp. Nsp14]|uniref:hypothetical protein n=1 Tax=Nitrosospira sp. Nsp14 TaxID=1855333 RepID=UPI001C42FE0B